MSYFELVFKKYIIFQVIIFYKLYQTPYKTLIRIVVLRLQHDSPELIHKTCVIYILFYVDDIRSVSAELTKANGLLTFYR